MSKKSTVVGVFRDTASAQFCVNALLNHGYPRQDINVMMSEQTRALHADFSESEAPYAESTVGESRSAEGMGVGGALGTAVGASLAAIAAIGTTLVIPGLNLIIAGPIAAALAGGGAGAMTGGLVGAFVGLGFTKDNAEVYHHALREGGTVLGVTARQPADVGEIEELMRTCAGEHVQSV